jgi:hypothetical protein
MKANESERTAAPPLSGLSERSRGQLAMLTAQFLLGMAVNFIGFPSVSGGFIRVVSDVLVGLHVLIAVGMVIAAFIVLRLTLKLDAHHGAAFRRPAWIGATGVLVAIAGGVLTTIADSSPDKILVIAGDWWSFLMSIGFLAAFLAYGAMHVRARVFLSVRPE